MKLSTSDYKKILKFYKLSIPKKSKNIKKKADKIIAKKFCSCIKKVQKKFKKEGIAIGICTKSVITRKGYKRGKFRCKKRRTVKLQKGGGGCLSRRCRRDSPDNMEELIMTGQRNALDSSLEAAFQAGQRGRAAQQLRTALTGAKLRQRHLPSTPKSKRTQGGKRRKKKTRKKRGGVVVVRGWWDDITLNDIKLGETYRVTTTSYRGVIPSPFIGTYNRVNQNADNQNIFRFSIQPIHPGLRGRGPLNFTFPEGTIQRVEQYNIAPDGSADMSKYINQFKGGGRRKKKSRKKRGGTANLCKLFYEKNNGEMPPDANPTVINNYCKDHGDTNVLPNDANICDVTTGNCSGPVPVPVTPAARTRALATSGALAPLTMRAAREQRQRIHTVSVDDQDFDSQFGGKKDINQERFKLIKMEAKKLLDNNKEIIKKIEKKHNIKILKNSKAIKKILDKTTLKDILKFKEKLMKIQKGGTREDEEDVSCAICLEDFTNERRSIPREEWRFPCNHYRNHCIDCLPDFAFSGFDPNKIDTCPICRAPLITTFMERRNRDIQTLYDNIYLSDVVFVVGYCVITYLNQTGSDGFVGRTFWQIFFTFFLMFMAGSVRHDREIWRRRGEIRRQTIEAINNNAQLNELLLQGRDADAERAFEYFINYANQQQQEGGKLDYMWDNMHDHFLGVGNGIENTLNNLSKLKYDSSEKDKDRIETKKALLGLSNEINNIKKNQIEWGKIIKDTTLSRDNLRQKLETLQSSEKAKYRWPEYSETSNGSPPRPTIEQADIINTKIKELLQPHQQHSRFKVKSQRYKKNRMKIQRATRKKMSKGRYGQRLGIILEGGKRRRKTRKKRGGCKWDKIKGWFNCGTRKKSYIKTIKIPKVSRKKINNTKRNSIFFIDEDEEEDDDTKNLKFMEAGIDGLNTKEDWARGPTDIDENNDIPIINFKFKQEGGNKYF